MNRYSQEQNAWKNILPYENLMRHAYKKAHWLRIYLFGDTEHYALSKDYGSMHFKGNTVLDIGSGFGETAELFLDKKARYVYGYDMSRKAVEYAKERGDALDMQAAFYCKELKIGDLQKLIRKHKLRNAILKMDIEGGEYDVLLSCPKDILHYAFSEIGIEYHYGYLDLERWLVDAGYEVEHTPPIATDHGHIFGMLHAKAKRIGAT
jgi:SAM-dependent methyltransferase